METASKETKYFSKTLLKQDIKSNRILAIVILVIMIMMSTVINFAMSIMSENTSTEDFTDQQKDFYSYLYVMASYNDMAHTDLSYDDFAAAKDKSQYEAAFAMLNKQSDMDLSVEGLETVAAQLGKSEVSLDTYVKQFEYTYALGQVKGCFSGKDLNIEDMMDTMLEVMGVSPDLIKDMSEMDMTTMLNHMYYTVMGLLPIFLYIVIVANSLLADQVDRGSMAYVLSTPTRRSAVTITQAFFLIVSPLLILMLVCISRIISSYVFFDEVNVTKIIVLYLGMYILVEAVAGLCYLGSCLFSLSKKSMAFGGGLTVWFFLASLLGMFGSDNMVSMGVGVDSLSIFNKLTLVGLFDIDSIGTIGSDSLDTTFIWKLAILAAVAVVCYVAGSLRFQKKDLPL